MTGDKSNRPTINVTSNYQSGGITAHTVNLNAPPQRQLGTENKNLLLQRIPLEKEVVVWATLGHEESYRLAAEIFSFMKSSGYRMFGDSPMPQMFVPQLYGVQIRLEERAEIDVGMMTEGEQRAARASADTAAKKQW